jgi:hypothetical protein
MDTIDNYESLRSTPWFFGEIVKNFSW